MGGRAGPHQRPRAVGRHDGRPRARARSPRRRTRRRRRLAAAPVQRGDPRRPGLGSRRRRHEGLRRDAALHRARARPRRRGPGPAAGALLHRRRGGRRAPRAPGQLVRGQARVVRGLHLRRRRGRRVLHHRARPPALPDRGGREGHGLDAADREGQRRARVDAPPRQRGDHPGGGGRADRPAPVAGAADAHDAGAARRRSASWPGPRRRRRTPRSWSRSSAAPPGCSEP